MTKLICYELNEVPWKVLDHYVNARPNSFLAKNLHSFSQITTHTTDSGELHPWSTWPTMHRGVNNDVHDIRYINQDLSGAKAYPPLWQILADSGRSVGICGSLQSYPPLGHAYALFHIPDTFAQSYETLPRKYESFQKLNLRMTGENRAVASKLSVSDVVQGAKLLGSGVSPKSAVRVAAHLLKERFNKLQRSLRPIMQAYPSFDIFWACLISHKPDYAAFFTNHVAGTMHRYWKYSFPEDFKVELGGSELENFHAHSILKAMDIVDVHLAKLSRFSEQYGYELVVSSSMGQEAVDRGTYVPEIKLDDPVKFARALNFDELVEMKLAMQPDVVFEFASEQDLWTFLKLAQSITDTAGHPLLRLRYPPKGKTLNLSLQRSDVLVTNRKVLFDAVEAPLGQFGLSLFERDIGTGYHQPNGVFLWKGSAAPDVHDRQTFDSRVYAPTILEALGIKPPNYMTDSIYAACARAPAIQPSALPA